MRPPFLVALVLLASAPVLAQPAAPAPADGALHLGEAAAPLQFAENRGQWPAEVLFQARLGNGTAWVTREGVVFDFYETVAAEGTDASRPPRGENPVGRHGHVVAMRFLGGTAGRAIGHGRQPATHSYFLGGDPTRWAGRVALFDEVVLQDLYEGIDLRLYGDGGRLRYDLVLAPGTDPAQVRMRMDGAEAVALTAGGALRLATRLGPVEHRGLAAYQVNRQGHREAVGAAFTVDAEETVGFAVDRTDPRRPLVIDPLVWATFLGGSEGRENVTAIAVGADGVTVAGSTTSADLPTTLGAYDESSNGAEDAFVARLSADGATLVWATFLGGGDLDKATALGVAADGAATVAGWTFGDGFPTTPGAFDTSFNSACCFSDAFVTRLSADGSHLVYSTFLGGFESDYALGLALGPDGDATVGGATASVDFPTTPGVVDPFFDGGAFGDGFVTRLSADGSALLYSTFLGGAETDEVTAVARADDGSALAVGLTESADFPATPGAFASAAAGGTDAFAARLAPGGDALHYATFLGGASFDDARGVTAGTDGAATVVGSTSSADFPATPGAFASAAAGGTDAFAARLAPGGDALHYATFLGGASFDAARGVATDADGSTVVVGSTRGADFPTTAGAFDASFNGEEDAFVARLSVDGSALHYGTFFGGGAADVALAVALDADEHALVGGSTHGLGFPATAGALDPLYNGGGGDAFVARLNTAPSDLTVSASALNSPVARGDRLRFTVALTNGGPAPLMGDLALEVAGPEGFEATRAFLRGGTLDPGKTTAPTFAMAVPLDAPLGLYAATVTALEGGTTPLGRAPFSFEVVADGRRLGSATEPWAVTVLDGSRPGVPTASASEATEPAVYPNPASTQATFAFTLDAPSAVRLVLFDVLGRAVRELARPHLAAGTHRLGLDLGSLPAGVYVWRLETGAAPTSGRLTLCP